MGWRLGRGLGALLALAAAVPVLARIVEPYLGTPVPQLAAGSPIALPVWVVATLLLAGRRRVLTLLMVALLGLQLWWWLPSSQARAAERPATGGTPLVVMTQNAQFGEADPVAIVRAVSRYRVDLLVVTELTPQLVQRLNEEGLGRALPFQNVHPAFGAAGTGLWSHWPVHAQGQVAGLEFAAPRTVVDVPGGRSVMITGVHPQAPHRGRVALWRHELAALRDDAAPSSGSSTDSSSGPGMPRIYAGDFNAGRSHSGFRAFGAVGYADAADAHPLIGALSGTRLAVASWGFTWPADRHYPPLTRIDHVLVQPSWFSVTTTEVVPVPGTDHRGLVASIVLRDR